MYKVTAYFKNKKIVRSFYELYDAIDFRDTIDAHYPLKVTFEKGKTMREWVYDCWNSVMDMEHNPLKNIHSMQVRHMIMQILAWMWCMTFAQLVGSWYVFGFSAIAHVIVLGAIAITVGTFETAKRKPQYFGGYNGRGRGGEHE
jgi:hypothetical protein|tara:strand:+ start:310 stop:741 length:432 start_codon:yes stop_codon:yes gene_type:complete